MIAAIYMRYLHPSDGEFSTKIKENVEILKTKMYGFFFLTEQLLMAKNIKF